MPGRHSEGWSSGLRRAAENCAFVIVAWLLTYTNAMKVDVGCIRDGAEKWQECECGLHFPFCLNVLPLVDGQTQYIKPSDTMQESGAKPMFSWGNVYVSKADLGVGRRTICNLIDLWRQVSGICADLQPSN